WKHEPVVVIVKAAALVLAGRRRDRETHAAADVVLCHEDVPVQRTFLVDLAQLALLGVGSGAQERQRKGGEEPGQRGFHRLAKRVIAIGLAMINTRRRPWPAGWSLPVPMAELQAPHISI